MQKTAFLFPGQGAQYVGMGKDFFQNFSIAREVFEEANDILHEDLSKIIPQLQYLSQMLLARSPPRRKSFPSPSPMP